METGKEPARVTRSKEQARAAYDRMSRFYDLLTAGSERRFMQAGLSLLNVSEGERVLEIGFGTGRALAALAASAGDSGRVFGIDISDGMLAAARRRLSGLGLEGRVELERGDAASLPYDDTSFDAVFMSFTLELFDKPEIPAILAGCFRVLRPGGRVCVVSMSDRGDSGVATRTYIWAHRRFPAYVDCRPIDARDFMRASGFDVSESREMSMWGLPVDIVLALRETTARST